MLACWLVHLNDSHLNSLVFSLLPNMDGDHFLRWGFPQNSHTDISDFLTHRPFSTDVFSSLFSTTPCSLSGCVGCMQSWRSVQHSILYGTHGDDVRGDYGEISKYLFRLSVWLFAEMMSRGLLNVAFVWNLLDFVESSTKKSQHWRSINTTFDTRRQNVQNQSLSLC